MLHEEGFEKNPLFLYLNIYIHIENYINNETFV